VLTGDEWLLGFVNQRGFGGKDIVVGIRREVIAVGIAVVRMC
jgi:hypothetical protein